MLCNAAIKPRALSELRVADSCGLRRRADRSHGGTRLPLCPADLEYGSEDGGDEDDGGDDGEDDDRVHTVLEDDSFHCFDGHQGAPSAWLP